MPLAFETLNQGTVAFGFFNIESDLLLLEHDFFFATQFCTYVNDLLARGGKGPLRTAWKVYEIADPERIGDLMGAIHGVRLTGFIGAIYRWYPFPRSPLAFKQNPEGHKTQARVKALLERYATRVEIPVRISDENHRVDIGEYGFSRTSFQALIRYVWRGGYPRWKDGTRPDYVRHMKETIEGNRSGVFENVAFE